MSTYEQRFTLAIHFITGAVPTPELVADWLGGIERPYDLQSWYFGDRPHYRINWSIAPCL